MIFIQPTKEQLSVIEDYVNKLKKQLENTNDGWIKINLEQAINQYESIIKNKRIKIQPQTYQP